VATYRESIYVRDYSKSIALVKQKAEHSEKFRLTALA
jgi:dTDP-D-glucose 4,6-dehydratase